MTPGHRRTIAALVIGGGLLAVVWMQYDLTATQGVLSSFGLGVLWGHYVWERRNPPPDDHVSLTEIRNAMRSRRADKEL